jgi:uncharacterized lipoprotein YmbA
MTGAVRRHLTVSPGLTTAVVAVTLSAAGCVSKPALVSHLYTIDPPPARASAAPGGVILALQRVDVAPPYSGEHFIYRTGNHAIERDPYARFASPPGSLLTEAIRGYLANAEFVRDVVSIGESLPAHVSVEVSVREIAGDLQTDGPAAVLALRFRVLSEPQSTDRNPELFLKMYTKSVPIPRRAAKDVVEGWNKGLEEIMAEFLADLKSELVQTSILE